MANKFPGLHRGPIDHQSSSVINLISTGTIVMGDVVKLDATALTADEILPNVERGETLGEVVYGIAVGGDNDGVYGDGSDTSASADNTNKATTGDGQGVVVVTQGRCLARVITGIAVNDELVASGTDGALQKHTAAGQAVIAVALQPSTGNDIIAVDVQRSVRHAV